MRINKKISDAAFKCRGLFWGIFAAGMLIFPATFSCTRFIAGVVLLIAGQLLRLWAAGYIPKYRTEVIGAPVLITWGPYKWIRNPLYAGNALMGLGWSLMAGWWWVAAFAAAFLILYSLIVIPAEEEFLAGKFGVQYEDYRKKVPALIPWPRAGFPSASPHEKPFDAKRSWEQEIYSIRVNLVITALLMLRLFLL